MYLANHQIIELYECDIGVLENSEYVKNTFREAVKRSKATVVAEKYHNFNPYGLTGVAVITESHISIHTWPEFNYAAVDVFSCDDKLDGNKIKDILENPPNGPIHLKGYFQRYEYYKKYKTQTYSKKKGHFYFFLTCPVMKFLAIIRQYTTVYYSYISFKRSVL